jgi:hypothetical protein
MNNSWTFLYFKLGAKHKSVTVEAIVMLEAIKKLVLAGPLLFPLSN